MWEWDTRELCLLPVSQRSQYRKRLLYAQCVRLFVWHFRFPEDAADDDDDDDEDTKFPFK